MTEQPQDWPRQDHVALALLAQNMALLTRDVSALQRDVRDMKDKLSRAQGAAWALSALIGLAMMAIASWDWLKSVLRGMVQ